MNTLLNDKGTELITKYKTEIERKLKASNTNKTLGCSTEKPQFPQFPKEFKEDTESPQYMSDSFETKIAMRQLNNTDELSETDNYNPVSLFPEKVSEDEWIIEDRDKPMTPPGSPPRSLPGSPPGSPPRSLALSMPSTQIKINDSELKSKWDNLPENIQKIMTKMILERKAKKSEYTILNHEQKQIIKKIIHEYKESDIIPLSKLMEESEINLSSSSEKINPEKIAILNIIEDKSSKDETDETDETGDNKSNKGSKKISFNL